MGFSYYGWSSYINHTLFYFITRVNKFDGKRYTTIVHAKSVFNITNGQTLSFPNSYGVYDNTTKNDVAFHNFFPTCYEDIENKAVEMNNELEAKQNENVS